MYHLYSTGKLSIVSAQACFDANTGKYSSCTMLSRASDASGSDWTAIGLLMTKTHIIVTGSDGSIEWLVLPTQPGGNLEVGSTIRVKNTRDVRSCRSAYILTFALQPSRGVPSFHVS